jgi:peptide-methionine (S)-S-oxide reductase
MQEVNDKTNDTLEIATFGAGCFWCVEAVFQRLKGVTEVQSGYSGGTVKNPSYKEVCAGTTGHAEVLQISFNPQVITYAQLLEVLFATHDPTTLNRQGGDVGTQYRSAIFYHNEEQKRLADLAIKAANESGVWDNPIVTEVTQLTNFYPAEDYHNNYFNLNAEANPYCQMVIVPKVEKFKKRFAELLK